MNLGDIITRLQAADPNQVVRQGFTNPHSYRGDYNELAFEPVDNITIGEMLGAAQDADGATYEGWKGGHFKMSKWTWCWLSEEGAASGETISPMMLDYMLAQPASRAAVLHEAAASVQNGDAQYNTETAEAALKNGGSFALIAYVQLAVAEHLRHMADKATAEHHTEDGIRHLCHTDDHHRPGNGA